MLARATATLVRQASEQLRYTSRFLTVSCSAFRSPAGAPLLNPTSPRLRC